MSKKNTKINKIRIAVEGALRKYDPENVDINRNNGYVNIIYHSRHNSFDIQSEVCTVDDLTEADIDFIADCYSIGYCW